VLATNSISSVWDWVTALVWTCRIFAITGVILLIFAPDMQWPPAAVMVPVVIIGAGVWLVSEIARYRYNHPTN